MNPIRSQTWHTVCWLLLRIKPSVKKRDIKRFKKKEANCLLFSAIKKVELFMANGGNLCYKKAINKMSALLLTVTFSIQGLLRRLDWRHNFIKNYNQNHTRSWECSLFFNARRYLAPPTFYSTVTNLVNHSLGWCILFLIGSAVPGAIFVENLWLQMYDVEGMALAPLSKCWTCKLFVSASLPNSCWT